MEPSVPRFIIFVAFLVLYSFGVSKLIVYVDEYIIWRKKLLNIYATKIGLILTIVNIAVMSILLGILTGDFYFWPLFFVAVITVFLSMLVEILWYLLSPRDVPWFARVIFARVESFTSSQLYNLLLFIGSVVLMLVYVVYMYLGFFGEVCCGNDWSRYVLQATIFYIVLLPQLLLLPGIISIMLSKNLMVVTRMRLFINLFSSTVTVLMFVSLSIWTTKSAEETAQDKISSVLKDFFPNIGGYFSFSPFVFYATIIYLLIVVVAPYLIGNKRSTRWIESLEKERNNIIGRLFKAFSDPEPKTTLQVLSEEEAEVETKLDELYSQNIMLFAKEIENYPHYDNLYKLALSDSKKRDPRFIHVEKLEEIQKYIDVYKPKLDQKILNNSPEYEVRDIQRMGSKLWETLKSEQNISDARITPWVMIAITTIVGSIISLIISSVAKIAVESMGIPTG